MPSLLLKRYESKNGRNNSKDAGEVVLIHSLQQPSSNDLNEYFSKRFLAKQIYYIVVEN